MTWDVDLGHHVNASKASVPVPGKTVVILLQLGYFAVRVRQTGKVLLSVKTLRFADLSKQTL